MAAGYYAAGSVFYRHFGLTYLLVFVVGTIGIIAVIGFVTGTSGFALGIGWADNLLHLAIALVLVLVGYGFRCLYVTVP